MEKNVKKNIYINIYILAIYIAIYIYILAQMLNYVWLFATLWTVVCQAPLSMGFSKPDYWSELSFPSPGALPDPGIKHMSLMSLPLAGRFFTSEPSGKPIYGLYLKSLCCTSQTLWNYTLILIIVIIIIKSTKNVRFTNLSPLWFLFTFVENLVTIFDIYCLK